MRYPGDEAPRRALEEACEEGGRAACATERKLPWYIVTSRRRLGNGLTTVAPFWNPVHLRNLWSRVYFWTLVVRGF